MAKVTKTPGRGSDNSGTRVSKREPVKAEADRSREINRLPQNMRVKVLLPSMHVRLMSVPQYEAWLAGRDGQA